DRAEPPALGASRSIDHREPHGHEDGRTDRATTRADHDLLGSILRTDDRARDRARREHHEHVTPRPIAREPRARIGWDELVAIATSGARPPDQRTRDGGANPGDERYPWLRR